ncbi:unnamed protein product, partial [Protopolystoma xenopodis]
MFIPIVALAPSNGWPRKRVRRIERKRERVGCSKQRMTELKMFPHFVICSNRQNPTCISLSVRLSITLPARSLVPNSHTDWRSSSVVRSISYLCEMPLSAASLCSVSVLLRCPTHATSGLLAASLLGQHPFAPSVSSSRCETSHLNSLPQFAVSAEEEATMSSRSAFPPNSTATPMPLLPPLPPTGLIGPLFAFRQSLGLNHAQTCLPNFSSSSSTSPSASSSSSSSSSSSPSSSSGYLGLPLELAT